ncbi:bifunctional diaminohydroxyphosphoribosylaminopyrimidine deaminase/5-amino-6-(5-phosphoribosylamino)uracil reductase [Nonomuraea turkmeniaca]|uniref:Riboflavin biosynthesis protein RibD n=1 Tax=Nonomuraea turkmeniaca TaxID=103838 RepID=A0A5S4FPU4_9ACTN|nr:dihydrofolate reductase family protein [Nonomuraea turkmeniaca]TMR22454.1 bifunctional diaminohydroxyphosphoribosylaminopyrimidine deaminase/5-amino-6-(5-phosphoribosylamino)uracil reductase [Nonomuraea turkmeniaca]
MASPIEMAAMRRAIVLSAFGLGATSPNPPVGCVILDASGRVAGEGYHERKGSAHAEGNALAAAGAAARGGTAIVTLEPCNHAGHTPACRALLLDAQVARVVVAITDPTSRGRGGVAELRAAGLSVETGVLAEEALKVLGSWRRSLLRGRPTLTWAYEVAGGRVRGAVGPVAAADELLWEADAVVEAGGRLWEAVSDRHGSGMMRVPPRWDGGDVAALVAALAAGGVRQLLVSGGADVAEPFLREGLIDEVVVFVADTGRPADRLVSELGLLAGFRIEHVGRSADHVRVLARRDDLREDVAQLA